MIEIIVESFLFLFEAALTEKKPGCLIAVLALLAIVITCTILYYA